MSDMPGWNSSAVRSQLQSAAAYIEGDGTDGDGPQELQRIDSTGAALGDPVPFNADHRTEELDHDQAGSWVRVDMLITTRTALVVGATYTWNSDRWTVSETGAHNVGPVPAVYHYSLQRQRP